MAPKCGQTMTQIVAITSSAHLHPEYTGLHWKVTWRSTEEKSEDVCGVGGERRAARS